MSFHGVRSLIFCNTDSLIESLYTIIVSLYMILLCITGTKRTAFFSVAQNEYPEVTWRIAKQSKVYR